MVAPSPEADRFLTGFARAARRVRGRLALRHIVGGASVGLACGALAAAIAWGTHAGALRPFTALGGVAGAAAGAVVARRRRWSDGEVALYLDGRLETGEAVATALEIEGEPGPVHRVVLAQATRALDGAPRARVRPGVWRAFHVVAPIGAAIIGALSVIAPPARPAPAAAAPGAETVQVATIAGLERVIRLAELDARDDAQRTRLEGLAEDAKRLRDRLAEGVARREAQADIAKLRDGIAAERLSLGDGEQRKGLEAALGKLGQNAAMSRAQKALGDRDLTELDRAMEELANKLEAEDRAHAMKTLEEAAEAARRAGAPDVARALEQERARLDALGKTADKLRALAEALGEGLGEEGRQALGEMARGGRFEVQRNLAEALEDALESLSDAERRRLAEAMKRRLDATSGDASGQASAADLADLAEQLGTAEGRERLADALKQMASEVDASDEAERQRGLGDAERGAGEAEAQLGGVPVPVAGGGAGPSGGAGPNAGAGPSGGAAGSNGGPPGAGGPSRGGGKGDHAGHTEAIDGDAVRSRASARLGAGAPMPGIVMGTAPGRAGETANVRGTGALGVVGPGEVGGIDRSDVPQEYREQVGRYFGEK